MFQQVVRICLAVLRKYDLIVLHMELVVKDGDVFPVRAEVGVIEVKLRDCGQHRRIQRRRQDERRQYGD